MNPRQDYRDGMYQQTGRGSRPPGATNMDQTAAIRSGLLGWWLSLTAPPRPLGLVPVAERERIRKAELTSVSMLAVFVFLVTLVSDSWWRRCLTAPGGPAPPPGSSLRS